MKQRCVILVGRLISHPCARTSTRTCSSCGLAVCEAHLGASGVCVVCSGDHAPPKGTTQISMDDMLSFDDAEIASFDEQSARSLHHYES